MGPRTTATLSNTMSLRTLHSGDTCTRPGLYIAIHCTPSFAREFQAGDKFTRCIHGQQTRWELSPPIRLNKATITTALALGIITVAAVFLIWPQELGPAVLRNAHVPFLYEARNQSHPILLLFGSQALLIVLIVTKQPKGFLVIWAIVSAATLPFAAELNRLALGQPIQHLVFVSACMPIFIKFLGHVPTGTSTVGKLSLISLYSVVGLAFVAIVVNTKLGPILAIVFGRDAVEVLLLVIIGFAAIILVGAGLVLGGVAAVRMLQDQNVPSGS